MDDRTRSYLEGRFGDYYRRVRLSPPPAADEREWGHIPFTGGEGTTMICHQSLLDLGDLGDFLSRTAPRHVYFSSARFASPGAGQMDEKGWRSADLVFDLDADHLPGVDPEATSYAGMLAACKDALRRLLDFLTDDFAFEAPAVVFSGGRGYHVHVRDESVRGLDSDARREIVDYVRAIGLDVEGLWEARPTRTGTTRRLLRAEGGWGRRVHGRLIAFFEELLELEEEAALDRLQSIDGVGEKGARGLLSTARENMDPIRAGNVEVLRRARTPLIERFVAEARADAAPIDEPVTTDTKRLIRLPGSLHGGTGLVVRRLDRGEIGGFDPLVDAVPERFTGRDVRVRVTDPGPVELAGDSFTLSEGEHSVRECVGVFLMARGRAEKVRE